LAHTLRSRPVTDSQTQALAIAGGAIATSLLDALHEKGILDLSEARGVLETAMKRVGSIGAFEASQIIADMLKTKYSARG
jgi:hypothetical protein